jgi:hypothetical protein
MNNLNDPIWNRTRELLRHRVPPSFHSKRRYLPIQFVSLPDFDACHICAERVHRRLFYRFSGFPSCYVIKTPVSIFAPQDDETDTFLYSSVRLRATMASLQILSKSLLANVHITRRYILTGSLNSP